MYEIIAEMQSRIAKLTGAGKNDQITNLTLP